MMSNKRRKIRERLIEFFSKGYFNNLANTEAKIDLILEALDEQGVDLSDPERMPLPEPLKVEKPEDVKMNTIDELYDDLTKVRGKLYQYKNMGFWDRLRFLFTGKIKEV